MKINFSKRTKLLLVLIIAAIVIAGGVFGVLYKTGKLGIGADTTSQQITLKYSGKAIDEHENTLTDATFIVADSSFKTVAKTATDSNGNYSIAVPVNRPLADTIYYFALRKNGYQNMTKVESQTVSVNSNSTITANSNFNLLSTPTPAPDNPCGTDQKIESPNLTICVVPIFQEVWDGMKIQFPDDYSELPSFTELIKIIQSEISRLRNLTNLPDVPKIVYLHRPMPKNWTASGYADTVNSTLRLSALMAGIGKGKDENGIRLVIDHEFGHFVDTERGKITTATSLFLDNRDIFNEVCLKQTDSTKNTSGEEIQPATYRCPSSFNFDFQAVYSLLKERGVVIDYATVDPMEMFAEIFAGLVDPNKAQTEKFQYFIENFILDNPLSFSIDNERTTIKHAKSDSFSQNNLMYAHEFVARKSLNKTYFPGTLYDDFNPTLGQSAIDAKIVNYYVKISMAKYTDKAVVSVKALDHNNQKMENTIISIGGPNVSNVTMRLKKDGGVFSDGSGDLFDTTGTGVMMPGPTGTQTITIPSPPSYYPIPFAGQTVKLDPGSNYVEVKYHLITVNYRVEDGQDAAQFRGIFESNNGKAKVTGLLKGSIPRYANIGYDSPIPQNGGYGVEVPNQITSALPNPYRLYQLQFLIGGGGKDLYPIKETLFGPSGSLIPLAGNPPAFPGRTEYLLQEGGGNIINGFFRQACFDPGASTSCKSINPPLSGWAVPSLP